MSLRGHRAVSLTGRLVLATVTLVAIACVVLVLATTLVLRGYLTDRLDRDVERSLERVQLAIDGGPQAPPGLDFEPPPTPRGSPEGSLVAAFPAEGEARGTALTSSGDVRLLTDTELAPLRDVRAGQDPRTIEVADLGSFRVAATQAPSGEVLVQGVPTAGVDETIRTLVWWELAMGGAVVVVAGVAGRAVVRRQLRPLRDIARTAERVTHLDLGSGDVANLERVPTTLTTASTEVAQVGESLNRLLGHVEDALAVRHAGEQQARQFLADASHELRTPLSTIKGYAELGLRMRERDDVTDIVAKVAAESRRMTRLVEDMLLLARLDSGPTRHPVSVDLSRLVAEAVHDASVVDRERSWSIDVPREPVLVTGDEQQLHQLVTNLLRNVSQHTPRGTRAATMLTIDETAVRLSVADDGPGIDPGLMATLFERFTRGDASRSRSSGGSGLGTSLVQAIAHAHGGSASVTSTPGSTTFTVALPRSPHPLGGAPATSWR